MATETQNDADLIARYVAPNPNKPGRDEAWLDEYGVSIWALIGHYQAAGRDAAYTAQAYEIPLEAMHAALAYYHQNQAVIEARLDANAS